MTLSGTLKAQPVQYEQLYPNDWTDNHEAKSRFRSLFGKIKDWPRDYDDYISRSSTAKADEIQVMLMTFVMLFSTDFLELDDPNGISNIQAKYSRILLKYLKSKYGSRDERGKSTAVSKHLQGMFIGSISREMKEIKDNNLK